MKRPAARVPFATPTARILTVSAVVGASVLAPLIGGNGVLGIGAPAAADVACTDYTFIGAAGSGEGTNAGGLGGTVSSAASAFSARVEASGQTVSVRPIYYPAAPVPVSLDQVGGFLASMNTGAANTQGDVGIVLSECPTTKVALAGFSQGAAAVHRALQRVGDRPEIVAAALIADPDRLPNDTTRNIGSAPPSLGMGQAAGLVSGASNAPLPPALGARTISACNVGDPVCLWTGNLMESAPNAHGSYSGSDIGGQLADIAGL